MAEMQVTVAGTTYRLDPPFFVLATLNPIEMEGTYPLLRPSSTASYSSRPALPEPGRSAADHRQHDRAAQPTTEPVFTRDEAPARIEALRALVREVLVARVEAYAAALIRATMPPDSSSPRAARPSCHPTNTSRST